MTPLNGVLSCLLGDDEVPSYEDTCSFTCNTGYELTGSDNRTCQSNGSWSGSEVMCRELGTENHITFWLEFYMYTHSQVHVNLHHLQIHKVQCS